jgi:hypothetical protein
MRNKMFWNKRKEKEVRKEISSARKETKEVKKEI